MTISKKAPWIRLLVRLVLSTIGVTAVVTFLGWLWYLFAPFFLGLLLATGLNKAVTPLTHHLPWKRNHIVLWLLFFVVLVCSTFLWVIIPSLWRELLELAILWETIVPDTISFLNQLEEKVSSWLSLETSSFVEEIALWVTGVLTTWLKQLAHIATELPQIFIQFFVFALSSYFFACDFPLYQKFWKEKVGADTQWLAGRMKSTVVTAFGGYLKAQGLLSLGVLGILLLGFWWMGLKFAFLLAILIAFLDFIPMIGAGLILLPWSTLSFFIGNSDHGWSILILWVITALFRRLLEPKVLGDQTGLSPLLSLISMYVGLKLAGIWGLIFAPVIVLVCLHFFALSLFQGIASDLNQVGLDLLSLFEENQENPENHDNLSKNKS